MPILRLYPAQQPSPPSTLPPPPGRHFTSKHAGGVPALSSTSLVSIASLHVALPYNSRDSYLGSGRQERNSTFTDNLSIITDGINKQYYSDAVNALSITTVLL